MSEVCYGVWCERDVCCFGFWVYVKGLFGCYWVGYEGWEGLVCFGDWYYMLSFVGMVIVYMFCLVYL